MLGIREARTACFAEDTVVQLVEGELDEESRGPIHEHMARCDDCRRLVAQVAQSLAEEDGVADAEPSLPSAGAVSVLPPGSVISRYALVELIGAGGTGVIYRAHDPQLRRDVALKLLRPDLSHAAESARPRLLREAQAMARLAHPNVVSVFDAGIFDEQVFVAMELVDGQTLKHWLQQPREVSEVLEMFAATARGLEAAHAAGLVHRDFKPTNVLVGRDGRPRVTDFGLARAVAFEVRGLATERGEEPHTPIASEAIEHTMTLTGTLLGTPAYMAPEQFLGALTDARTDQFSFCVALHEALYGQRPFSGETLEEIAAAVIDGKLQPVASGRVPQSVATALVRGLKQDPAERFASMSALIAALAQDPAPDHSRRAGRQVSPIALLTAAVGALAVAVVALVPTRPPPLLMTALHKTTAFRVAAIKPPSPRSEISSAQTPAPATDPSPLRPEQVARVKKPVKAEPAAGARDSAAAPANTANNRELIRDPWGVPP